MKKKYNILHHHNSNRKHVLISDAQNEYVISIKEDTYKSLVKKVIKFQKEYEYLLPHVSLTYVANHFGTNTKYLSYVLKKEFNTDFITFINILRITYICNMINEDKKSRQYKISYLAELSGYKSHSTFTTVFKKVKGCSPSQYISQIQSYEL